MKTKKHALENGEFIFETRLDATHPHPVKAIFEPCTLRYLPQFCSDARLLDEAPADETIEAAKRMAAECGGEVIATGPTHAIECGADEATIVAHIHAAKVAGNCAGYADAV